MNLFDFYYLLPYPARVVAASLRGYYLSWWRYSSATDEMVEAALDLEKWSEEKIDTTQEDHLARVLDYSAKNVPYYRNQWSGRRRKGDRASWERVENWPILSKKNVRENPALFISDSFQKRQLFVEHTSGTTGTPLTLYQSRDALLHWYALFEARWRRWNGVDRKTPWAILGGQMVASGKTSSSSYWVWNQAFNQLYLSSYHISAKTAKAYVHSMNAHGVRYLYGYASSMTALAQYFREDSTKIPEMKVILSNAEPLLAHQRELLQSIFNCPVKNTYGMSEIICGASECECGSLHLWPDAGNVEIVKDDMDFPVLSGESGRIIATGFLNLAMPLVRYEIGDRGILGGTNCACGRNLRILASVEGRMDDFIITRDGRKVGRLDPVFKVDTPINEAQIVQESIDRIVVNIVPAEGFSEDSQQDLIKRLQDRLGPMDVEIRKVAAIPRGPNGKFRAVVSKLHGHEN